MMRHSGKMLWMRSTAIQRKAPSPVATTEEFKMEAMAQQARSSFSYTGSAKGAEVGARNEAAFMNYETVIPTSVTQKLAMPNLINLLTVLPVYGGAFVAGSVFWGIFFWDLHARKHYESVKIERSTAL